MTSRRFASCEKPEMRRVASRWWTAGVLAWLLLVFGYLFALQAFRYLGLSMGMRDLGFFAQSLWNTLQGSFLAISVDPFSSHLWGYHFFLLHVVLIPFYALWPNALLLLAVQAAAVAATSWGLYLLGRRWLSRPWMAAVPVLAYTLHPQVHSAAVGFLFYGFHPEVLFPLFFVLAVYFTDRGRAGWAMVCWLLGLGVREDLALVWIGLGVYWMLKPVTRRLGAVMVVGSSLWLLVVVLYIIPLFAGRDRPFYFTGFMHLPLSGNAARPFFTIWPQLQMHLLALVRPFGFFPLLDPFSLIVVPTYGLYSAAWSAGYWIPLSPGSAHNSAILPVLAVSILRTLGGVSWFGRQARQRVCERHLVWILLLAALLPIACWVCGPPLGQRYGVRPQDFTRLPPARRVILEEISRRIPADAILSTDFFTGSWFLNRPHLQWLQERWDNAEYVVVDRHHDYGGLWALERAALEKVLHEPRTVRVLDREGFVLLRRDTPVVSRLR